MKLFCSDIKKGIKKAIKDLHDQIIFALIVVTITNIGSIGAIIDYNHRTKISDTYSISQSDSDNISHKDDRTRDLGLVYVSNFKDAHSIDNYIETSNKITESVDNNLGENVSDEEDYEEKKVVDKEVLEKVKKYLLDYVNNSIYKEVTANDLLGIDKNEFNREITIDNIDFFTRDQIIEFICEKYNLTEHQFKVIASVVYNETFANNYDDCYRVINTIYNRTKSKKWVNWISSVTGLDGASMYAQVIASGQFDGYKPSKAGYDYDELLNTVIYDGTKPFETTLDAMFEFLISEKSVHNFLSFKGLYYEIDESEKMKAGYGVTNWVKYTKLGNTYHNPLSQSDLIDEESDLVSIEENKGVLTRKRG